MFRFPDVINQEQLHTAGHRPEPHAPFRDASEVFHKAVDASRRSLREGALLDMEGGPSGSVYVLLSGWLTLSKSMADGSRQIVDIVLAGDIVDPSSADNVTSSFQIQALSSAEVAAIGRAAWARLSETDPMARNLHKAKTAAALTRMSERMLRIGKGNAETRISYALIELCTRVAAIDCDARGVSVYHLPLTQQVLGDFVGLSSVHVCRTMRRLTRSGIISMSDHMKITIHDLDALAELANIDLATFPAQVVGHPQLVA